LPAFCAVGAGKKLIAKNQRKPEKTGELILGWEWVLGGTPSTATPEACAPHFLGFAITLPVHSFTITDEHSIFHLRRKTYGKYLVAKC
jgi:hypothetical protein